MAALLIDWLISYGLALLSTGILVIWFLLVVVAGRRFGFMPCELALSLQVVAVDGRVPIGLGRLAVRGLLIAMVVPPSFTDSDGRGLHDRVTGTAVLRR